MALVLIGLSATQTAEAQLIVNVLKSSSSSQLIRDLHVLRDPSRLMTVNEIAQRDQLSHPSNAKSLNLGFTSDAAWVVFQLARENESNSKRWWLEVEQPLIMDVVLYEAQADGTFSKVEGRLPTSLREHVFDYRVPTFELTLTDLTPKTYYMRMVTQSSMSASLVVWEPEDFVKHHAESRFMWGLIYGAYLMIVLFYSVWWLWTRERIHLVYTMYVVTNLMASFFSAGWPRQFFPFMSEDAFLTGVGLWISLAAPAATYFTFEILQFREGALRWLPKWTQVASWIMFTTSMSLVLSDHYGIAMPLVQSYMLNLILMSAVIAGWRAFHRDRIAQFFLLAFGIFYVGVAWRFLKNIGWLEPNFWSNNAYQVGAFGHMLVMSVSVFANYSRLRQEKRQVEFRLQAESQLRQEQSTFLGMVSHEFRTPLSIIASSGENLLAERELTEQSRSRVEKILRANKRLSALMDEYLSYERLVADSTETEHELLDLGQVARRVRVESADAEGVAVQLEISGSVMVMGDAELLRVALLNLVNNARRHSPLQGIVEVKVRQLGNDAEVVVEDQGPGIEGSDRDKIFDKFFRGRNALGKPGAGMGLYLVKSIIEQHGGSVEQTNLTPQGCRFLIRLPAR